MVLLSEMVRKLADEVVLKNYNPGVTVTNVHDWTTRVSEQITLSRDMLVYVKFTGSTNADGCGNVRLLLDGTPVASTGIINAETVTREVILLVTAGTHTLEFQTSQYKLSTGTISITLIHIAVLGFPDKARDIVSVTETAPVGATTTVVDRMVSAPQGRRTCVGPVKTYTALVYAYMCGVDIRVSVVKNPGEANTSNALNWRIQVDGVDRSWKDKREDHTSAVTGYSSYGEGAYGFLVATVPAGGSLNIKINVYNARSTSVTVYASLFVVLCPWILADTDYEPLSLSFPQGSTLYVVMEPLTSNPTKTLKLGKPRFVSFGSATDYYSTVSGTDIVSWSYTFESVEVSACLLLFAGFGGCISIIAVDVR